MSGMRAKALTPLETRKVADQINDPDSKRAAPSARRSRGQGTVPPGRRNTLDRTNRKGSEGGARASVRTHKRGLWPNVRCWGESDMPGWRE